MGSIIIVSAFIQIGYILGSVALDKYIKVAEVARGDDDDDVPTDTKEPEVVPLPEPAVESATKPEQSSEPEQSPESE